VKILITGGAGFIGSHLADKLLDDNHTIYVIDNLSTGSIENIKHNFINAKYHFIQKDIMDYETLYEYCKKCDLIFHLASSVGVRYIMGNPVKGLDSNILASIYVIKVAAELRKKMIIFSSSEIYGKNRASELKENDDRIIGSSFRWSYSIGKAVSEYYAYAYGEELDLDYIIIRCFNIVGPRQIGNYGMVLPRLVEQALKSEPLTIYDDGSQIRTFTYVNDLVNILRLTINNNEISKQVFNIGSDNSISVLDLARRVKYITKSSSNMIFTPSKEVFGKDFEDIEIRIPNTDKIMSFIGPYKFYGIDEIIKSVVDYTNHNSFHQKFVNTR
jgi:UDP-glucose 4-epimerase